jgi:hypothetical protein
LDPLPRGLARHEERQHLYGLAEAHVVGQAAAEAEAVEEVQPAEPLSLVLTQHAGEGFRLLGGPDPVELPQGGARFGEPFVESDVALAGEQRIEESGLAAAEAEDALVRHAERGERP